MERHIFTIERLSDATLRLTFHSRQAINLAQQSCKKAPGEGTVSGGHRGEDAVGSPKTRPARWWRLATSWRVRSYQSFSLLDIVFSKAIVLRWDDAHSHPEAFPFFQEISRT